MAIRLSTRGLLLVGLAGLLSMGIGPATAPTGKTDTAPVDGVTLEMLDALAPLPGGIGALPDVPLPADNRQTAAKVELGRRLFFETLLSYDRTVSCATCHDPARGFADGRPLGVGFAGKALGRNSPTVLNAAFNKLQFWDGRASSLEEQATGPIMAAAEMHMSSEAEVVRRLSAEPHYRSAFQEVFGGSPSLQAVARAIAAFERTLVTRDCAFDRYAEGNKGALTDPQKRGLLLFIGKAGCTQCHLGRNFTDDKFYRIGLPSLGGDEGRFAVTRLAGDRGAFKTPSLRNVALTAPYMHDGSIATLDEVVDLYDRGGDVPADRSDRILPLELTAPEKADLVAFLRSLTGAVPGVQRTSEGGGTRP